MWMISNKWYDEPQKHCLAKITKSQQSPNDMSESMTYQAFKASNRGHLGFLRTKGASFILAVKL